MKQKAASPIKNEAFSRWLRARFEERSVTMRGAAKELGLQPSQVWKIFEGYRRIQLREIPAIATLAGVSSQELMARMGIVVGGMDAELSAKAALSSVTKKGAKAPKLPAKALKTARLIGWIDSALNVHEKDLGSVIAPSGVSGSSPLVAYRFQTMGGVGYQPFDGALAFVRHGPAEISAEAFGRLCVVRTGAGITGVRVVGRGYIEGTYNLFGFDGSPKEQSQALLSATPVVLIKFS